MDLDEKELIRRSCDGDAQAFGEIVARYQQLVYAVAFEIVRELATAQDVAQETFIAAFGALSELRSVEAFPSWLRRIAVNQALASLKRSGRYAPLEEAVDVPAQSELSGMESEAELRESNAFSAEVHRVVATLSDALKFPVLLCYLNGVPTAEAARFLGIKEGTLRKRLHDGKKKLQQRIVAMAAETLQEHRLPRGFARQCICGCRRARQVLGARPVPPCRPRPDSRPLQQCGSGSPSGALCDTAVCCSEDLKTIRGRWRDPR